MKNKPNRKIDPSRWYTAREAAPFLNVMEDTVKQYCRDGDVRRGKAIQEGRRKVWKILGEEIIRLRSEWHLDISETR